MNDLIINNKSRTALDAYLAQPTHALLLYGRRGVGLGTIAKALGKKIAGTNTMTIAPRLHKSQKVANINVEDIKELYEVTRTQQKNGLAIIVDEAEKMTNRTPETFLKLLEEPNENVYFILTTNEPNKMPVTVMSRVQKIHILQAMADECESLIATEKLPRKRQQITFLASGLPAEIKRLIADEEYFRKRVRNFELAKNFLGADKYEKLSLISKITKRDEAIDFSNALARLLVMLEETRPQPKNLLLVNDVVDNLCQNGNIRAQLTYLATNMIQ